MKPLYYSDLSMKEAEEKVKSIIILANVINADRKKDDYHRLE